MRLIPHCCACEYCHFEGEDVPFDNEIFEVMLSAFPLFRSTVQKIQRVVCHSGSERHHEHLQLSVEQYCCLHFPLHKKLSFVGECRLEASYLQ